jgi:hypothetical protein
MIAIGVYYTRFFFGFYAYKQKQKELKRQKQEKENCFANLKEQEDS